MPPTLPRPLVDGLDRLLERISYGHDPALRERALTLGWEVFLEEQLHPENLADPEGDAMAARFPTLSMSPRQLWDAFGATGNPQTPMVELQTASLLRAARSKRQLHERMVEFWSDHFSIDQSDSLASILKTSDDRDVIRVHALGTFPQLLRSSARSAAMLFSLGNYRSTASAPNENYGREILELHSLGLGHFTELDVRESARCFTGWTFLQFEDANAGAFRFEPSMHDNGPKQFLGAMISAGGGVADGQKLIRTVALHPATARRVSGKLCRWFHGVDVDPIVAAAAAQWSATQGDIRAVLRVLLSPWAFSIAPSQARKTKRPFHFAAGILRSLPFRYTGTTGLAEELAAMGHRPFHWPAPDGYPDTTDAWVGGLQRRWSFASRLFANQVSGVSIDVGAAFGTAPKTSWARRAAVILRGQGPLTSDVAVIQDYVDLFPTASDALRAETLALTASAPSFQTY